MVRKKGRKIPKNLKVLDIFVKIDAYIGKITIANFYKRNDDRMQATYSRECYSRIK
jgi:hypothetical protein